MDKICNICNEVRPLESFHRNHACKDGRISQCKPCLKSRTDTQGKWLKHRYGITKEQFQAMKDNQDGKCAICLMPTKKLCVDHCHSTKRVRGLLCGSCNSALGLFGENAITMSRAIEYVKTPSDSTAILLAQKQ